MDQPRLKMGSTRRVKALKNRAIGFAGLALTFVGTSGEPCIASAETVSGETVSPSAIAIETNQISRLSRTRPSLSWNMAVGGSSFANESEQAQSAGFHLGAKVHFAMTKQILLRAAGSANLQSGYAQSRFGDNTPQSGIALTEAVVQFEPLNAFAVEAGAIDQGHFKAPLLVSSQPFPGILEKIVYRSRNVRFELRAQQTIPTSTTLSTKTIESEKTPSFLSETIDLKVRPLTGMTLSLYGTHFRFQDLPSLVAHESSLHGNTTVSSGPNSTRFAYGFNGWMAGGEFRWNWFSPAVAWNIGTQMIQNLEAPQSYQNSQRTFSSLDMALPGDIRLSPMAEIFFTESDVVPAYYNSSGHGHTNRQGWGAGIDTVFRKEKFKVGARYLDSDLINSNSSQSRQRYLMIKIESMYETL